jgi:hypothetical protein
VLGGVFIAINLVALGGCTIFLALPLQFHRDVGLSWRSLTDALPERPRDVMSGPDASLREPDSGAADFLDRPADRRGQERTARRRGERKRLFPALQQDKRKGPFSHSGR